MQCNALCPFWGIDVEIINSEVYYTVRCGEAGFVVERQRWSSNKRGECVVAAENLRAKLEADKEDLEAKLFRVETVMRHLAESEKSADDLDHLSDHCQDEGVTGGNALEAEGVAGNGKVA